MTMASKRSPAPAGTTPPQNGSSLISKDKLLQLYCTVLKCRMLEERIRMLRKQHRLIGACGPVSLEAAAAGVGLDLLPGDTLAPSPRAFIPGFVKGLPLETIFGRIFSVLCSAGARVRSSYASLNLISPSLNFATQLDRAMSAAMANKASKNNRIAVAFCGNSSSSPGLVLAAMRRAGKSSLPILLVRHSHPDAEEIHLEAEDCGLPGVTVDGDDPVAVYRVATEAIAHARRGSGPTLIECRPWRLAGKESPRHGTSRNPVLNMERYLAGKGLFDRRLKSEVTANFRRELDSAIRAAGLS
jgi:pyruvate dehydrogenase E1 component alpha subunit